MAKEVKSLKEQLKEKRGGATAPAPAAKPAEPAKPSFSFNKVESTIPAEKKED